VPEANLVKGGLDRVGFVQVGVRFKKEQRDLFRKNAGYTTEEVARIRKLFNKYDSDRSDNIGTSELGGLIRHIFPVMNKSIRSQLDLLMKEIDADGPGMGQLAFDDFLRTMRQFHDIQNQERIDKMERLVSETGFNPTEVQGFRELFLLTDVDHDGELSESEVRHMIQKVCPLGDRNGTELHRLFVSVREQVTKEQGQKLEGSKDSVDFPEFLLLMRTLLDQNFANIQARLAMTGDGNGNSKGSAEAAAKT